MARRDELLELNEYLAHFVKSLALAAIHGNRTVSVLFGHVAAGAFIATALPGAEPSVMDLPSISRATQLPLEQLSVAPTTPAPETLGAASSSGASCPAPAGITTGSLI